VWQLFAPRLQDLPVEEFHVAVLDAQHRLHRDVTVTRGLLNSSLVHPREVFREAIAECAAAVVLVHNHPSGDPTPSADDRAVTDQLVAAGRLLDIPVHDHVIVGRGPLRKLRGGGAVMTSALNAAPLTLYPPDPGPAPRAVREGHRRRRGRRPRSEDAAPAFLFPLGELVATPAARDALAAAGANPVQYLARHVTGDWGNVTACRPRSE
jgi:hypothetical protein